MSRVPPTAVEVWVNNAWVCGTVRTCEVSRDATTCSAVVSYTGPDCTMTGRFPAEKMRKPSGERGCPAAHRDESCCG